ncbi:MAG: TRAP transporter small permease subunit [Verrucomicrobia bacterium]|nr:TRAP transporter small permease subunit [Verrucomicrobiota bacterium]
MQKALLFVDRISAWVGIAFSWSIVVLTGVICYDVTLRYLFRAPTSWAFDVSYMLYGTLFIMAGAYTLSRGGHVRGDVLYGFLAPRLQASIDLILYILFFIPGIAALAWFGIDFAQMSWKLKEHSSLTPGGPPMYHFKTLIPIAGVLVLLQGFAEIARCIICLKEGEWPDRLKDVEEVEVDKLKAMVHYKEDPTLDAIVVQQLEKEHKHDK